MNPTRIQLRRSKGWRKPEGAVVVARPSRWGNWWKVKHDHLGWKAEFAPGPDLLPYGVAPTGDDDDAEARARQVAVDKYRRDIRDAERGLFSAPFRVADVVRELRGHDLACWCPLDQPCHADVLLELANAPRVLGENP